MIRPPKTLAVKLGICIFVLLAGASLTSVAFTYGAIYLHLHQMLDRQLLQQLGMCRDVYQSDGLEAVRTVLAPGVYEDEAGGTFFRILDVSGRELASSSPSLSEDLNRATERPDFADVREPRFQSAPLPSRGTSARIVYVALGDGAILQRGVWLTDTSLMMGVWTRLLAPLVALVFFGVVVSLVLAWRAMSGVRAVTETAAAITHGDFSQRVNIFGRGEEVDKLATTFNAMLDQIEALLIGLKEVTDDLAHDLRSPITLMRGLAERFALTTASDEEHAQLSGTLVESCDKLLNLINTMLDISEMNAGVATMEKCDFDLADMVRDTCALFQPLAEESAIALHVGLCPSIHFWGDKGRLHRAVANLMDNAIKYTQPGGHVTVSVDREHEHIAITVEDDGLGIAAEDLPRIFERFYRPDHSRSLPGNGLGLSLSMAIAKAHEGTITVQSEVDGGSSFTLRLPDGPRANRS
ncbi:MAG TPA: HAMP domain-containing sensor histidine kinase [Candidatus Hydrogenedentes bacterium]|nr:HAMP domain-containing sensor histidine kinase [Candidatus Hydrogenedentota bacterium]HPG66809.1 HAMP domain-containing sensor histidine kinase [Candidatus Hydrogenedentota bacterium]